MNSYLQLPPSLPNNGWQTLQSPGEGGGEGEEGEREGERERERERGKEKERERERERERIYKRPNTSIHKNIIQKLKLPRNLKMTYSGYE